ncbi:MAG TPA: helix-turn-helix domain-containing protein, partial [Spirochaetota bacterium]|nr:helix-turn-helix domain-containing protein [Spirochaetota bacterium]
MSLSNRQQREKNRKSEEIISAARSLFFQNGFEQTSMDDIATASEFSKRTLYKYFQSKEQLASAVIGRAFSALQTLINQKIRQEKTGYRKFKAARN